MSTRMPFFWNLAAALGGRKWTVFCQLWDFKEDDSWQMPHSWRLLVLFEVLDWQQGDAHQPLVTDYFTEHSWARSGGCAVCHLASRKWDSMSFIFRLCCLLSHFLLLQNQHLSGKDFMVSGSSRPCEFPWEWLLQKDKESRSAVSFSHFTVARLSRDMTHS